MPDPAPRTVDQLRQRIDAGLEGDKVPEGDPASTPLGTDDEAAGFPPTQRELRMAATKGPNSDPIQAGPVNRPSANLMMIGIVAVVFVVALILFFALR